MFNTKSKLFLILFSAGCLIIFYVAWNEPTFPDDIPLIPMRLIAQAQNTKDKEKQIQLYDSVKNVIHVLLQKKTGDTTLNYYLGCTYSLTNDNDSAVSIHLANLKNIDSIANKGIYKKTNFEIARSLFLIGMKFMAAKDVDQAKNAYYKSFKYVPYFAASAANLAQHQVENNQIDSAKFMLNESIKLFPDKAFLFNVLGYAYFKENNFQESKNCFLHSLELNPGDTYATNFLNVINSRSN